jgi:two-component system KDP operon response regulator KdpE
MISLQGKRVLIVDDDFDLLNLMEQFFASTRAEVFTAASGQERLRQFYAFQPDVVILDLMLPQMSGWEVCRNIRMLSDTPILILTALGMDGEIIRGLDCGADDYITKPVNLKVLEARVRATLRRTDLPPPGDKPVVYNDGYLTIDLQKHLVLVNDGLVKLSATEYRLLLYLFENADRLLTFQQILDNVWGEIYRENVDYIHVYVSRLRQKLEKDSKNPVYLLSERGVGYRFETQSSD